LSKIFPSNGLRPVPDNPSQNGQKPTLFMTSPTKKQNPKPKIVFSVQTRRLAKSFERLNSSQAQSANKLRSCQEDAKT